MDNNHFKLKKLGNNEPVKEDVTESLNSEETTSNIDPPNQPSPNLKSPLRLKNQELSQQSQPEEDLSVSNIPNCPACGKKNGCAWCNTLYKLRLLQESVK